MSCMQHPHHRRVLLAQYCRSRQHVNVFCVQPSYSQKTNPGCLLYCLHTFVASYLLGMDAKQD